MRLDPQPPDRARKKKKFFRGTLGLEPGTFCTGSEALTIRLQCMAIRDMASVFFNNMSGTTLPLPTTLL